MKDYEFIKKVFNEENNDGSDIALIIYINAIIFFTSILILLIFIRVWFINSKLQQPIKNINFSNGLLITYIIMILVCDFVFKIQGFKYIKSFKFFIYLFIPCIYPLTYMRVIFLAIFKCLIINFIKAIFNKYKEIDLIEKTKINQLNEIKDKMKSNLLTENNELNKQKNFNKYIKEAMKYI